jgi:hypothetical protein
MPNFATIAGQLTAEAADITAAWDDARIELNTQGAPEVYFLEINFTGGRIRRTFDDAQVSSLPSSEQLRLYPQLGGLFNLAMRNKLYP